MLVYAVIHFTARTGFLCLTAQEPIGLVLVSACGFGCADCAESGAGSC